MAIARFMWILRHRIQRAGKCVRPKIQLAWNLYLEVPDENGELLLWDKQWREEDDVFQVEDNYYYSD